MPNEIREPEAGEPRLTPEEVMAKALYGYALEEAVQSIEKKKINHELIRSIGQNIERENDRSCAIILCSLIDEVLQDLILEEV